MFLSRTRFPQGRITLRRLVMLGTVILILSGVSRAQTPLFEWNGPVGKTNDVGSAVAAGDFDGDGVTDFAIGSGRQDLVEVFQGGTGKFTYSIDGPFDSRFGDALATIPDIDGDGADELVIGAHVDNAAAFYAGSVHLYSGKTGVLLWTALGTGVQDRFGISLAHCEDLNGDGLDDVIVGATEFQQGSGRAHVLSGRDGSTLRTFHGVSMYDNFGLAVVGLGDVNGDSIPDVAISAPYDGFGGSVTVFSGTGGTWRVDRGNSKFGHSLARVGDHDGDGVSDYAAGSPWDGWPYARGKVEIISSATGAVLRTFKGVYPDEILGASVASAGDVNGDGVEDLIVGAPGAPSVLGPDSGRAYVFSTSGECLYTMQTDVPGGWFGSVVAGVGDQDQDGYDDVIAGGVFGLTAGGTARVYGGAGLVLDAESGVVSRFGKYQLRLRGAPLKQFRVTVVSIDGVPINTTLLAGTLDTAGVFEKTIVLPPGTTVGDHVLRATSVDAGGQPITSNDEWLLIR